MQTGIDPKVDFAFKWLFGREKSLPILAHLLNAVLELPQDSSIVELELLNPFSDQDRGTDKLWIVDIKARDKRGRLFDVEMQMVNEQFFRNRILYYWSGLHQQQLVRGDDYDNLRPTYCVCFTNFTLFPETTEYRLCFELRERTQDLVFSSDIAIITLELPKFTLYVEEVSTALDQWLYLLRNGELLDTQDVPPTLNTPQIRFALEELAMLSQDDMERERYLARLRVQRDERARLAYARNEGIEEGIEKGRAEAEKKIRLVESIHSAETKLVSKATTPLSDLFALSLEELTELNDQLAAEPSKDEQVI